MNPQINILLSIIMSSMLLSFESVAKTRTGINLEDYIGNEICDVCYSSSNDEIVLDTLKTKAQQKIWYESLKEISSLIESNNDTVYVIWAYDFGYEWIMGVLSNGRKYLREIDVRNSYNQKMAKLVGYKFVTDVLSWNTDALRTYKLIEDCPQNQDQNVAYISRIILKDAPDANSVEQLKIWKFY